MCYKITSLACCSSSLRRALRCTNHGVGARDQGRRYRRPQRVGGRQGGSTEGGGDQGDALDGGHENHGGSVSNGGVQGQPITGGSGSHSLSGGTAIDGHNSQDDEIQTDGDLAGQIGTITTGIRMGSLVVSPARRVQFRAPT